ncbi:WD40 repeat-like protein [Suhomyces tanzawaensis NRRL Y-17324]|uniref:WD40 repeat-like protein n=1 Tax=Suhomyces tanzawaensis NRRL Y-17324 TaxID=984487 RepID=A0A1E4SBP2_9ASCO|nr:WD40 repeat-like protein [Suhomyces tanzawaensis NRRL Y-17324]ODV76934.1 WD40 repeat-like protein [Suhomyces tanzawaensis NRRL Y-17324]
MTVYTTNSAVAQQQQAAQQAQAQQQQAQQAQAQQQQQQQAVQQRQQHQQRLSELLDAVKQEFDYALNEASSFKQVKEDYDLKYNQQTAEMQQIRQTVYELEMAHRKIKEAYEEEILRLKTELENRDRQAQIHHQQAAQQAQAQVQHQQAHAAHAPKPNGQHAPYGGYPGPGPQAGAAPVKQLPAAQEAKPVVAAAAAAPAAADESAPAANEPVKEPAPAAATAVNGAAAPTIAPQDTSTALTVIDKSQYVVNPADKALHVKEIPPFLTDLDVAKASPDFKKQKLDYYVLYNPAFQRDLDVELVHSLDHSSVVCCVRFSKDGQFIATGCNKTTQVFNVETGELVAKLIDDNNSTDAAAKTGATNGDAKNGDAGAEAAAAAAATAAANGDLYIRSVCFSPDGKLLATGAEDKLIRIWDLQSKKIIKILRGHEQDIYSLDFFPDGNRLVSGSGDRTVRIWDLRSSQCSLTLSIEDGVTTVAVSPDGNLIAAGSLDRTVRVWDSTTGFLVERLDSGNENGNGHGDSVYSVAFSINGKQIASGSLDRTVKLWNLEGRQDPHNPHGASGAKKSSCEVTYIGHKDFVLSVCSTPKNEYILSGSKDRGVIFWDQLSGNPLLMLQGHRNSVISVAVSLNSQGTEGIFATGSGDCKARLWKWTRKA